MPFTMKLAPIVFFAGLAFLLMQVRVDLLSRPRSTRYRVTSVLFDTLDAQEGQYYEHVMRHFVKPSQEAFVEALRKDVEELSMKRNLSHCVQRHHQTDRDYLLRTQGEPAPHHFREGEVEPETEALEEEQRMRSALEGSGKQLVHKEIAEPEPEQLLLSLLAPRRVKDEVLWILAEKFYSHQPHASAAPDGGSLYSGSQEYQSIQKEVEFKVVMTEPPYPLPLYHYSLEDDFANQTVVQHPSLLMLDKEGWEVMEQLAPSVYQEYLVVVYAPWEDRAALHAMAGMAKLTNRFSPPHQRTGHRHGLQLGGFDRLWAEYNARDQQEWTSEVLREAGEGMRDAVVRLPSREQLKAAWERTQNRQSLQFVAAAPLHRQGNISLPLDNEVPYRSPGVYLATPNSVSPNISDQWFPLDRPGAFGGESDPLPLLTSFVFRYSLASLFLKDEGVLNKLLKDYSTIAVLVPPAHTACWEGEGFTSLSPVLRGFTEERLPLVQSIRRELPFFIAAFCSSSTSLCSGALPSAFSATLVDVGPPLVVGESPSTWVGGEEAEKQHWRVFLLANAGKAGVISRRIVLPHEWAEADIRLQRHIVKLSIREVLARWPAAEVTGSSFESALRKAFHPLPRRVEGVFKGVPAHYGPRVEEVLMVVEDTKDSCAIALRAHWLQRQQQEGEAAVMPLSFIVPADLTTFHRQLKNAAMDRYAAFAGEEARQQCNPTLNTGLSALLQDLPAHCEVYCVDRQEELISLSHSSAPPAAPAVAQAVLHSPTEAELEDVFAEIEFAMLHHATGQLLDVFSSPRMGRGGVQWSVWLPEHVSAPVIRYHFPPPSLTGLTGTHYVLLYDSSCGVSSNYLKSVRALKRCWNNPTAQFYFFDLAEMWQLPWEVYASHIRQQLGPLEPILSHYLLPGSPSRLLPPQLVLLNETSAVVTLPTASYVHDGAWLPAVSGLLRLVEEEMESSAEDETWRCVDQLAREDSKRRSKYRAAVRRSSNSKK